MSMTFQEARQYLSESLRFGIRLGLQRMQRLMDLLGNPQDQLRCLHVAGTNGKGSVSVYTANILAAAGYRTGLFTSPYINRLTERIRVLDGLSGMQAWQADETHGEIDPAEFARLMEVIKRCVDQMLAEGLEHPTEFELLTAMTFCYFRDRDCQIVVLETGLGGRFDSTNIISQPLACLITALGFDHMDRLGPTIRDIAGEKAGIIKPGVPVYLYDPRDLDLSADDQAAALEVITTRCRQENSTLHLVSWETILPLDYDWSGQRFQITSLKLELATSMLAVFQPMNAQLAVRCCLDLGLADREAAVKGVAAARWPARMERLRSQPPVLIDGAHNGQSCLALRRTLDRLLPGQPLILVAGMLADKDVVDMLAAVISPFAAYQVSAVICTAPDNPRALPAVQLADAVDQQLRQLPNTGGSGYNMKDIVQVAEDPKDAVRQASRLAEQNQWPVCAFGSLYLMGAIRAAWAELDC